MAEIRVKKDIISLSRHEQVCSIWLSFERYFSHHPTCIDLILTKSSQSFHNIRLFEKVPSDFHRKTVAVMKTYLKRLNPKPAYSRDHEVVP